jgi:hypothetical protein
MRTPNVSNNEIPLQAFYATAPSAPLASYISAVLSPPPPIINVAGMNYFVNLSSWLARGGANATVESLKTYVRWRIVSGLSHLLSQVRKMSIYSLSRSSGERIVC